MDLENRLLRLATQNKEAKEGNPRPWPCVDAALAASMSAPGSSINGGTIAGVVAGVFGTLLLGAVSIRVFQWRHHKNRLMNSMGSPPYADPFEDPPSATTIQSFSADAFSSLVSSSPMTPASF